MLYILLLLLLLLLLLILILLFWNSEVICGDKLNYLVLSCQLCRYWICVVIKFVMCVSISLTFQPAPVVVELLASGSISLSISVSLAVVDLHSILHLMMSPVHSSIHSVPRVHL